MLVIGVASAIAVVFLNSINFGLSAERVFDSLIHTLFIASAGIAGILYVAPRIYDLSTAGRVPILLVTFFVTTIVGLVFARMFLRFFGPGVTLSIVPGLRTFSFSLLISYIFGLSGYFYLHSQNKLRRTKELLRKKELAEADAKSLAVKAQLASLESRIHPHFLFNTLNSIAALIKENPDKAEKFVEKLAALLRYSLDFSENKLVSFAQELKITEDYLEIESARFARKLQYSLDVGPGCGQERLPAFSLQTLVENSIKHVAAKRSGLTTLKICAKKADGRFDD